MKVCATIEARMGSTRLPGKVLLPLAGKESLWHIVDRLSQAKSVDKVIVATTSQPEDQAILDFCHRENIPSYAGSQNDIADRILQATKQENPDIIVQATGDNPLICPDLVDEVVQKIISTDADYAGNHFQNMPLGLEVRAFKRHALEKVAQLTDDPIDLVHGSYFIYRRPDLFCIKKIEATLPKDWMPVRLTVDEPNDYKLAFEIYKACYQNDQSMTLNQIFDYLKLHPELAEINQHVNQKKPEHA